MEQFQLNAIGTINATEEGFYIEVAPEYRQGLKALEGFSHISVLWWASQCDFPEARVIFEFPRPYKSAPEEMGVFATRSPARPNPIALTTVYVLHIDEENGRIYVPYIDTEPGTPLLDIKPYTPSFDRVEDPGLPAWCSHWPKNLETSGDFDWESEMIYDK